MIKGCLFDLDGTLLDTLKSIRYYLNCTLEKYGVRTISEDETKIFVGKGAKNLVERSISAAGIDLSSDEGRELLSKVHPEYVALYDAKPEYLTEPYEGITEAIDELYKSGADAVISHASAIPSVIKNK